MALRKVLEFFKYPHKSRPAGTSQRFKLRQDFHGKIEAKAHGWDYLGQEAFSCFFQRNPTVGITVVNFTS